MSCHTFGIAYRKNTLLDGIAAVRNAAKEIIDDREVVTSKEVEEIITINPLNGDVSDSQLNAGGCQNDHP